MKEPYLLRMPPKLKEIMAARASMIGISINALILQILWAYVGGGEDDERC